MEEQTERQKFSSTQWMVLATVMIASFLGRLDGTIVNLALPKIISQFGLTVSQASWISTGYIIANAIFVPIFGKLGDLIGRKSLYLFGIIGFVITSAMAGLSFNLQSMVIFRILQGMTVSIDYPLALSIIAYEFKDKGQRATAMGLWSAVFAVAAVFGPLLGGPLIDNFGWRSVFYINIPLGAIGTYMAWRYINEPVKEIKGLANFDILGALVLGTSLGTLVLVLDQGQSWGWTSFNSWLCYSIVAVATTAFIVIEKRAQEPVVDLKFFSNPVFTFGIITSFISFMGLMGGIFLIPLFAQTYLGFTVTKSGYLFVPMAIGLMFAAPLGGRLSQKIQPRWLIAFGMVWSGITMLLFAGIDIRWTFWDIAIRLMLFSFGLGLGLAPLTQSATSDVPIHEVGIASSVLALARNIAGAFGIAIFATILSNSITSNFIHLERGTIMNTVTPSTMQTVVKLMAIKANILAYKRVFQTASIFLFIGAFTALFVKRAERELKEGEEMPEVEVELGI